MYGKPFNEKRPFGETFGIASHTYEQDGNFYNAQKEPVDENGNVLPLAPVAAKVAPKPAAASPAMELDDDDTPADEKPMDLRAWANGDPTMAGTPWQSVRNAAQAELGDITELKSKEALKKALLEHFNEA